MNGIPVSRRVAAIALVTGGALWGVPPVAAQSQSQNRAKVSQHGITWTFDRPAATGQFVTGDWWVAGPVVVVAVDPPPGMVPDGAAGVASKNRYGDAALRADDRMRNGSMVNPKGADAQGYDSRAINYQPPLSIKLPCPLVPGQSLVSTVSHTTGPNDNFMKGWGEKSNSALKTAAVLTCVTSAMPPDAFRPAFAGDAKTLARAKSLKRERLLALKPVRGTPPWDVFARYFERPWIDHVRGWVGIQAISPTENMPDYGREFARLTGMGSLMLNLEGSPAEKERLLIGMVQLGIDLYGIAQAGGSWNEGGGLTSGRKWPILFAGLLLDDKAMQAYVRTATFHEDAQTYYGKGWTGATALYQMVYHHGVRTPYEEKPPAQWDSWDKLSEDYRRSSTSVAWVGEALAARLMGAVKAWGHDAFFDYCDRWMSEDDAEFAKRIGGNTIRQGKTFDPFVDAMWAAYRKAAPAQEGAAQNLKFVVDPKSGRERWEANPKEK
jgi:hypothetical protein